MACPEHRAAESWRRPFWPLPAAAAGGSLLPLPYKPPRFALVFFVAQFGQRLDADRIARRRRRWNTGRFAAASLYRLLCRPPFAGCPAGAGNRMPTSTVRPPALLGLEHDVRAGRNSLLFEVGDVLVVGVAKHAFAARSPPRLSLPSAVGDCDNAFFGVETFDAAALRLVLGHRVTRRNQRQQASISQTRRMGTSTMIRA